MSKVRPLDTTPERVVRSLVTGLGRRYRLHRHAGCKRCTTPARNGELWREKFARTVARDVRNLAALGEQGWRVLVVWECETADAGALRMRLADFLREA